MQKKWIFLFVVCLFTLPALGQAQGSFWKKLSLYYKRGEAKSQSFQRGQVLKRSSLKQILLERAKKSRERFYLKTPADQLPLLVDDTEMPAVDVDNWTDQLSGMLYQRYPSLKKASDTSFKNYLVSLHNRLAAGTVQRRKQIRADIRANVRQLMEKREVFSAGNIPRQAAAMVSPQVKQILIGEEHNSQQVSFAVLDFIKEIQARDPKRPIIYFTEMLPRDSRVAATLLLMHVSGQDKNYYDIFSWLYHNGVGIKGLEIEEIWSEADILLQDAQGQLYPVPLWKSLSGIYLRNTAWLQTIQNYRKKYPEALFIIHAGAWHTGYIMPFSLANAFNPTETFVVHFIASRSALLDILSDNQVRAPVLTWKDKNLAHIAGFDVQITTGL